MEASRAIRQAEVGAVRTMIDWVDARSGLYPEKLAADSAYGAADMLSWLVHDRGIEPHIPVIDHSQRDDGTFSRADFVYDHEGDLYRLVFAPGTFAVLAIVFCRACIDSAFGPARQAAIQAATPAELLARANGLHHAINQTSKIAGPALGGLLLTSMPVQSVMGLNIVLSLLAAVLVFRVDLPPRGTGPSAGDTNFRETFLAGIVEFRRRPLAIALAFSAFAYFSFFLYDALIAVLTEDLGLGIALFGLGISASGAGGIVGALLAGRISAERAIRSMASAAVLTGIVASHFGVAWFMGWQLVPLLYLAGLALMGGSTAFMLVPYRAIVQTHTPDDRAARVAAAGDAITMAVMLSAPFIGSAVAAQYGVGAAFVAGGVLIAGLGLISLIASLFSYSIQTCRRG